MLVEISESSPIPGSRWLRFTKAVFSKISPEMRLTMRTTVQTLRTLLMACGPAGATITLGLLLILGFAQSGVAQQTTPLNFENNYFVTGDYVVAGVGLRGLGVNGFATQQLTMPEANSVLARGVPKG